MARFKNTAQGLVSETLTIDVDPNFPHVFVAARYFTDDTFLTPATPTAGSIAVTGRVEGNEGYSILDGSPIDCTDNSAITSAGAPLNSIQAAPMLIDVASYYEITVTATES